MFAKLKFASLCRPGHGAPTQNIRKKKFTELQLTGSLKRSQSMFSLEDESSQTYQELRQGRRYNDDMALQPRVSFISRKMEGGSRYDDMRLKTKTLSRF